MYRRLEAVIATCLYYSGLVKLARWWKRRSGQSLVILNYHRATGGDLRKHLLYLRRHYRLLHLEPALEELYRSRNGEARRKDRRTALVLTFDDGYYDNYTHALKLACELHVPITIFLIPGYIESGNHFWWLTATCLVTQGRASEVMIEGQTYHLDDLDEREDLIHAIDARARHAPSVSEREVFLASVTMALAAPTQPIAREKAMLPLGWAEVQDMQETGWVSFGAHTMHHPILAYLTDPAEVKYEVDACRRALEQRLGYPVRAFAYPVGGLEHIGENSIRAVREAGFEWALTTMYGFNTAQSDPYLLHRIEVDVDQHWLVVAAKTCGLWNFFTSLCRIPGTFIQQHVNR